MRQEQKTAYRYRVDSTPQCGPGKCSPIEVHAATRAIADLRILAVEQRFHEQHARQDNITFEWTIRDRHGLLLISATTTPEGTTYH